MFEHRAIIADRGAEFEEELYALESVLLPMSAPPIAPSNKGFEFPKRIWVAMLSCYAVFFASLFLATGGSGAARFVIIVSILYTAIYFGVARIGVKQAGPEDRSPLDRGERLMTSVGPMDAKSVYGQVLVVPVAIALFGFAILAITTFVG